MKTIAVTIGADNDPYLPLWKKYYSQYVDEVVVLEYFSNSNWTYWREVSEQKIEELLQTYDIVLFALTDEFIVPKDKTLREYLRQMMKGYARCTGYEVVEKQESPLDLEKPILMQRNWWVPYKAWNKPLITRVPLKFTQGWHMLANEETYQDGDPNLLLIHLKRADFALFIKRWNNHGFTDIHEAHTIFHEFDDMLEQIPKDIKDKL